jgi:hypothetical protein
MNEPQNGPGVPAEDVDLAQLDDEYAQTPLEERENQPVPDGKYQVKVEKVELGRAKTSGNPLLKWQLRILGPSCKGRMLFRNNMLATRENLKWLKADLHVCGMDLAKLSDLSARVAELLDVTLEVTKRSKGESDNVYFNRRLVLDAAPAQEGGYEGLAGEALAPF